MHDVIPCRLSQPGPWGADFIAERLAAGGSVVGTDCHFAIFSKYDVYLPAEANGFANAACAAAAVGPTMEETSVCFIRPCARESHSSPRG